MYIEVHLHYPQYKQIIIYKKLKINIILINYLLFKSKNNKYLNK
jgi:hypothetical protein